MREEEKLEATIQGLSPFGVQWGSGFVSFLFQRFRAADLEFSVLGSGWCSGSFVGMLEWGTLKPRNA